MKRTVFYLIFFMITVNVFSQTYRSENIPDPKEVLDFDTEQYLRRIGESGSDAYRLNGIGLDAYQEGDLFRAAKLWYCAIEKDSEYAWSHYNFACVMSLFAEATGYYPERSFGPEGVSEEYLLAEPFLTAALMNLKKAVILDPSIFEKMAEDSDLKLLRRTDEFRYMLLYPKNDPSSLLKIHPEFFGSHSGAYPDGGSIRFFGNRFELFVVEMNFENTDSSNPFKESVLSGTFSVRGEQIVLSINSPEKKTITGQIKIRKDSFGFITGFSLTVNGRWYGTEPDYSA